jgi:hypothetical protein
MVPGIGCGGLFGLRIETVSTWGQINNRRQRVGLGDLALIRASLQGVTGGLATAFESTLVRSFCS